MSTVPLDTAWYRLTYRLGYAQDPRHHFETVGRANLVAPGPGFSPLTYLGFHSDEYSAGVDPYDHAHEGVQLGFEPNAEIESVRALYTPEAIESARTFFGFDADYYVKKHPHAAADPEAHYRKVGERAGHRASNFFNGAHYETEYADQLADWAGTALDHFLAIGVFIGNFPCGEVAEGAILAGQLTAIDWLAHWQSWERSPILTAAGRSLAARSTEHVAPRVKSAAQAQKRVLNWVIPSFDKGSGGHTTIFRAIRTLRRLGWRSVIWVTHTRDEAEAREFAARYVGTFPSTSVEFRPMDESFLDVENEFLIATAWRTAYEVQKNAHENVRLYFLQDWESEFSPMGDEAILAEKSYDLGFDWICAGSWLQDKVEGRGGQSTRFELCAEPILSANDPPLAERTVLAAIYIRGAEGRRCPRLMIEAANRIADAGVGEVVVFGGDKPVIPLSPNVRNLGVLSRDEMSALLHDARFGLVASATNYSILPVEMAAAGCVVVQPDTESTRTTVRNRGGHSTQFSSAALADFVIEHAELDTDSFDELRGPYQEFARGLSWEHEFENLAEWLEGRLAPECTDEFPTTERVAVVIPTYYPSGEFPRIVEAVAGQLTSYDVVIQIVDSRHDGEVSPIIEAIERSGIARVHPIDAADFQHGDTRSMAVDLVDADHYVYITDDARPMDEYWLESLVAPLSVFDDVAYVFGRHRAHPYHHRLYDAELTSHFDGQARYGYVTSQADHPNKLARRPTFRATLAFNSDNNAAYCGALLKQLRFPSVPFAEDQALSRDLLDMGYSRAFASDAVVFHSHDYSGDLDTAINRGKEEAQALFRNFGLVLYPDAKQFANAIVGTEQSIAHFGARLGLTEDETLPVLVAKLHYALGAWEVSQQLLRENPDA